MKDNTKELTYARHPRQTYLRWGIFYVTLFVLASVGFSLYASQIRTYHLPTGAVTLSVPYNTYLVGESITFKITNDYNSTLYITNSCPREPLNVYHYENNTWTRIHDTTDEDSCAEKARQIAVPAHGQQNGSYDQWPNLFSRPGKYRIVAYVDYFNSALYQDFEVIAKPDKQAAQSTQSAASTATPSASTSSTGNSTTTPSTPAPTPSRTSTVVSVPQGSINVQYDGTTVYIQSIASSCQYETNGMTGSTLEVTFKCGGSETQVLLRVRNGVFSYAIGD